MKAITLNKSGGTENFMVKEIDDPRINPNEVLIKVKAISINPVDAFARQHENVLRGVLKLRNGEQNLVLGWDISGTVVDIGSEVTKFQKEDDVFGMVNFPGQGRAYAEYIAAPEAHLALKPQNISHEEAAAATLAALTAWQALVTHAKVKRGDKVLIHAAGGGVGHYAVQIAKHLGAYVIGTASGSKRDFVTKLGADEFIDHTTENFEDKVNDSDVILDSISAEHLLRSMKAVKKGGRVISIKATFDGEIAKIAKDKDVLTHRLSVSSNGDDMRQIAKLLGDGEIHSHISIRHHLNNIAEAHREVETGKTKGKIVLVP